jgi:hypothetical protein
MGVIIEFSMDCNSRLCSSENQLNDARAREVTIARPLQKSASRLASTPFSALSPSQPVTQFYDFEVIQGDEMISSLRSVELRSMGAVWGHVAELTKKVSAPKSRIRVLDQSGGILISIGIATARLLETDRREPASEAAA